MTRSIEIGERFQFERTGYFVVDSDATPGEVVFNRSLSLKDTWAKVEKKKVRLSLRPIQPGLGIASSFA